VVRVELTDAPGGENTYRIRVAALDPDGKPLWSRQWQEITDHDRESPGVQLVAMAITRRGAKQPGAIVVPTKVRGIARLEVVAEAAGTGQDLRVLVPVPSWW